jgi:class 3 adenylate cyclase
MRVPLERHGGIVEKFIGDAVLAVFGLAELHADDAVRAVRAASEMREAVSDLNEELQRDFGITIAIGVGVNTGEVVAGDPGGGRVSPPARAVNIAARFEGAAKPGEILIGEATYRLIRDSVTAVRCKPLALQGKRGRTSVFRLINLEPAPADARSRPESPFVGRTQELRTLVDAFERASPTTGCRLVTVVGLAGIGKSRLARELLAGSRRRRDTR